MKYQLKENGPQISDVEVRSLERKLGHQLPIEYLSFLLQTNGGKSGDLEFQRGNGAIDSISVFYGLLGESKSGDILWSRNLLEDRLGTGRFLAIAHTPCGDEIILDLETGGISLWIHDAEAEIEIMAETFEDFWNSLKARVPDAPECDFERWRDYHPNWRGKYGHSVVEAAAIAGRVDIVKESLEAGLSPGECMRCGAMNGHMDVIDFLILKKFDINQLDSVGRTPLDWTLWKEEHASALRTRGAKTGEELKSELGGCELRVDGKCTGI